MIKNVATEEISVSLVMSKVAKNNCLFCMRDILVRSQLSLCLTYLLVCELMYTKIGLLLSCLKSLLTV